MFLAGFLFLVQTVFAHPPSTIHLQYDAHNQKLLIDIRHVSHAAAKHYIQKIEVIKNEEPPLIELYRQQVDPNDFKVEWPLAAKEGDTVKVIAYSRQGGSAEETLKLTVDTFEKEVVPFAPPSRSTSTTPQDPKQIKNPVPSDPKISKPTIAQDPTKNKAVITFDPSVAKPAAPKISPVLKPAVPTDPSVIKPAVPKDSSQKPAVPSSY